MSISLGNWTHLLGRTKTIWDSEGEPHEMCVEAWGAHSCVLYAAAAPSAEAAPHSARCLCSCPGLSLSVSPAVPVYNAVVFLFVLANFSMATFMDPGVFPRGRALCGAAPHSLSLECGRLTGASRAGSGLAGEGPASPARAVNFLPPPAHSG